MLHLARKAFHPGPLPFPLLHIDTTWKFRDMIAFRDKTAALKMSPSGLSGGRTVDLRLAISEEIP